MNKGNKNIKGEKEEKVLENKSKTLIRLCANCQRANNIERQLAGNHISPEKRAKLQGKLDNLYAAIATDAKTAEPVLRILRNFVTITKHSEN